MSGRQARAVGTLVLASALWGVSATGTKYCLAEFGPATLLAVQLCGATVVLWAVLLWRGYRPPQSLRLAAVLGVLEPGCAYLGQNLGLARTSASNAAVVSGLESTFVVVLAAVFLRERANRRAVLAVGVGLVGLLVLERTTWLSSVGWGDLLVAGGMMCAAGYTIVARRYLVGGDALSLTAHQFAVAAALSLPLALVTWSSGQEHAPAGVSAGTWALALLIGIVGFGGSFLLYNRAIAIVDATTSAVVINLIPAFGLLSAIAWLGEPLTGERVLGGLLVLASVTLFTWPHHAPGRHSSRSLSTLGGTVALPQPQPPDAVVGGTS